MQRVGEQYKKRLGEDARNRNSGYPIFQTYRQERSHQVFIYPDEPFPLPATRLIECLIEGEIVQAWHIRHKYLPQIPKSKQASKQMLS